MLPGQLGNIDAYIQAVNRIPLLTPEEERQYATEFREGNNLDSARRLVLSHLRLVVSISRNYLGYGLPHGDLIQEGNIGLMKAVKRFDPAQNVRLVSYAIHWIKAEIHEYILRNWRTVKVATTKAQRKLFFNLRSHKKGLQAMTPEEIDGLAKELNVKREDVTEMETRLSGGDIALEGQVEDGEESYAPIAYRLAQRTDRRAGRASARHAADGRHRAGTRRTRRAQPPHHRGALAARRRRRLGRLDAARSRRRVRCVGGTHPPDRGERDEKMRTALAEYA